MLNAAPIDHEDRTRVGERTLGTRDVGPAAVGCAVSWGSGEVADHGVAFRPEANVGQVTSGILHSGWCDHSSVAPRSERTTATVDKLTPGKP
jgi:hypothetical protein